ncbi:ATP-binding protein [Sphingomonas sp. MA1305]|uniref:ATP-binding protein n=1 Tax=Sphingomonas sp. MA1305 TaxID=2479204 RepID=UPI0018E00CBB|nr:ATP-binding protein [Sphingomonas sp. MA1305]
MRRPIHRSTRHSQKRISLDPVPSCGLLSLGLSIGCTAQSGRHRGVGTMHARLEDLPSDCRQGLVELLTEAADVGTWDWDIVDNRFSWSPKQYAHFGIQPVPGEGLTYERWLEAIHKDDQAMVQAAIADTIASGCEIDLKFRVLWRDDEAAKVDVHWIHSRGRLIRGLDGSPLRMIGTSRDVTESEQRLALARAHRDAELADLFGGPSRFDVLFEETSDCLVQLKVEADGRFTYQMINPSGLKMIGMTMAAAHGLTPVEVLGAGNGGQMEAALRSVVETGLPVHYEPTFDYSEKSVVYDAIYMPLRDERGSVTAILCRARDVTEQRQTALALQQSHKISALGHMAAGVAHDFNNTLTSLRGCFLRLAKINPSAEVDWVLEQGSKAIRQGEAITRRLLTFARKQEVPASAIDLQTCLNDALPLLEGTLPGVEIAVQPMEGRCDVIADHGLLQACLLNLGLNARDARPHGCKLVIGGAMLASHAAPLDLPAGRYATITVRDNGPGMPAAVLRQALEPYFTTKPSGKGTGLGLSMVMDTARSFGGTVRLESELGRGTSVIIYLQIAADPARSVVTAEPSRPQ